ncbi:hypothetical protein PGB90_006138 [Kerria lacca]
MPPNSQNIPSQLLEARRCWKMLFHLNTALNERTSDSLTWLSQENEGDGGKHPFKRLEQLRCYAISVRSCIVSKTVLLAPIEHKFSDIRDNRGLYQTLYPWTG